MQRKYVPPGDVPKEAAGNDILETSRNAALESAANLLETLSHARKLKQRARAAIEEATEFHETADGTPKDFLFDMLRLNASYLNELAKLGNHHKSLVQRALENLYSAAAANSKHPSATELEFDHTEEPRQFMVQNDAVAGEMDVAIEWVNPLSSRDGGVDDPFHFAWAKGSLERQAVGPGHYKVVVPVRFGVPSVILMSVYAKDFLGRRYRTELTIKLQLDAKRTQVRRIPVNIDMRGKVIT